MKWVSSMFWSKIKPISSFISCRILLFMGSGISSSGNFCDSVNNGLIGSFLVVGDITFSLIPSSLKLYDVVLNF
jgi:hypothetical protein